MQTDTFSKINHITLHDILQGGDRLDGLNYVLSLGIDLDRVQSMLADGLTMQEIVEAVQRMQSRGEAVDNITDTVKPNDYSDA